MNEHFYDLDIHSSCRTCLKQINGTTHHDIFTTPDLKKKLNACTSLAVELDDGYPPNLCEFCRTKIEDFYNFQVIAISAFKRFQEYINSEKKPCTLELGIDTNNKQTEILVFNAAKTEPEELDNEKLLITNGNISFAEDGAKIEPIIKCYISDDEDGNSLIDNNRLQDIEHFTDNIIQSEKKLELRCEKCNLSFKKFEILESHMREHQGRKAFACQQCDKTYATPNRLEVHIQNNHTGKKFPCTENGCNRIMASERKRYQHMKNTHWNGTKPKIKFVCKVCGKVLSSSDNLRNHSYMHSDREPPHECPQCKKRFIKRHKLKEHMDRHAGIRNYTCSDCGAKKSSKADLKRHMITHAKRKSLSCQLCNIVFRKVLTLNRHKRIVHDDYSCSEEARNDLSETTTRKRVLIVRMNRLKLSRVNKN